MSEFVEADREESSYAVGAGRNDLIEGMENSEAAVTGKEDSEAAVTCMEDSEAAVTGRKD